MIKGAKTIQEYKILQWVQENFEEGRITVQFLGNGHAKLFDKVGGEMELAYQNNEIVEISKNGDFLLPFS